MVEGQKVTHFTRMQRSFLEDIPAILERDGFDSLRDWILSRAPREIGLANDWQWLYERWQEEQAKARA